MNIFLTIAAYGEIALWISAFFLFFFQGGNSFSEAASYAILCTLMTFSFLFQTAFLLGYPGASLFLEVLLCGVAVWTIARSRSHFKRIVDVVKFVFARHPVATISISVAFGYLGFLVCVVPPAPCDQCHLEAIETLGGSGVSLLSAESNNGDPLFPMNAAILPHLFLRADSRAGTGLIGFLAYLSIGFSTYALSRRYAWPPTAFTVTLITLSFPRLVFLSTTPGMEIVPAAASLFCILSIYRSLELPEFTDFVLLVLAVLFSISGQAMCLTLPAILVLLSGVLFIRRHGKATWTSLAKNNWKIAVAALVPALVFSQAWLFAFNIDKFGGWLGAGDPAGAGEAGNVLLGAVANIVRYFFQSAHFTVPLEILIDFVLGFSLTGLLVKIYELVFDPLFGMNGAGERFSIVWAPNGEYSWFGPFGILFVVPSVILAIVRGHRRLKAIALALAGYVYVIALAVPWMPGNASYFTVVFACGGFCVSFLLPPWRFSESGKKALQAISILLLFYACLFNTNTNLIDISPVLNSL